MPEPLRLTPAAPIGDTPTDLTGLRDVDRRQVGQRLSLIQAWRRICDDFAANGRTRAEATDVFVGTHPEIARASLYRWSARYEDGGLLALLDGRSNAGRTVPEPAIDEAAWQYFLSLYLTTQRRTVALCHLMVAEQAREAGWKWPALRTVQRRVQRLDSLGVDYYRFGEREWRRRHEPKLARDFSQYRANQWWVGDFHEFDVFCRRSAEDPRIVRPLLSAFIDLRSRLVVGWHVTLTESQDTVLLAFRRGVEQYGPPEHAVIDNGKPYRAQGVSGGRPTVKRKIEDEAYVRSVMGGLSVAVHFSIPHNPDSKLIERWFGTLESQFGALFESYCGGGKDDRFRLAHKLAQDHPERCPTVADLAGRLADYLKAYHATPHSGDAMQGLTPAEAFSRCDPIARRIAPEGALDLLLMRVATLKKDGKGGVRHVKVTNHGVRCNGVQYGAFDPRVQRLHGQEVLLRVDPVDASYVVICDLAGRPLCRAINNRAALAELGQDELAEGMKAKARARKLARQISEGALTPLRDDAVTAGIRARVNQAKRLAAQRATGTDDATPVRNVTPLRSDWAEAVEAFNAQATPAPSASPPFSWADIEDDEPAERPVPSPAPSFADFDE